MEAMLEDMVVDLVVMETTSDLETLAEAEVMVVSTIYLRLLLLLFKKIKHLRVLIMSLNCMLLYVQSLCITSPLILNNVINI